jgi:hypothetical protein
MQLERVTAEIRPRNDWEAVDLGLALTRRDFWRLWGIWWLMSLPVAALIFLWADRPVLWAFVWWWWKPQCSRMVLFDLSRRLFDERPGWRGLVREAWRGGWRNFGRRMLWGRLSPRRLLAMPVEELEGLRGAALRRRGAALMARGGGGAVGLALVSWLLCGWLILSLLTLWFGWLIPSGQGQAWADAWDLWRAGGGVLPLLIAWTFAIAFAVSVSVVDVFAVGAGFGLYLNRRTWIEGWDVELVFKRLAERLRAAGMAAVLFAVVAAAWGGGGTLRAGTVGGGDSPGVAASEAAGRRVIDEVLEHEDFKIHKRKYRVRESHGVNAAPSGVLALFFGAVGWVILVLAVGAVLGFLGWLIYRYRYAFAGSGGGGGERKKKKRVGVVVSGLEIRSDEVPDDPPAAAARMWSEGRKREALALLYRAAILWLVEHRQLELGESATEYDCVRRVAAADAGSAGYFKRLTGAWVMHAYGSRTISDEEAGQLCRNWPFRSGRSG